MTPPEKAKALVDRFMPHAMNSTKTPIGWVANPTVWMEHSKTCAKICVQEILDAGDYIWSNVEGHGKWEEHHTKRFYEEVLIEIDKL